MFGVSRVRAGRHLIGSASGERGLGGVYQESYLILVFWVDSCRLFCFVFYHDFGGGAFVLFLQLDRACVGLRLIEHFFCFNGDNLNRVQRRHVGGGGLRTVSA